MTWFEVRITPDGCLAEVSPQFEEKRPARARKEPCLIKLEEEKKPKLKIKKSPKHLYIR